jgi:hemerythrin-like domain-containing protein
MFISETGEANYCKVKASKIDVDNSNQVFAALMRKHIMKEQTLAYNIVSNAYDTFAKESNNDVAKYNHERLILA